MPRFPLGKAISFPLELWLSLHPSGLVFPLESPVGSATLPGPLREEKSSQTTPQRAPVNGMHTKACVNYV